MKMAYIESTISNFTIKKMKYILNYPYFYDLFRVYCKAVEEGHFPSEFKGSIYIDSMKLMSRY